MADAPGTTKATAVRPAAIIETIRRRFHLARNGLRVVMLADRSAPLTDALQSVAAAAAGRAGGHW